MLDLSWANFMVIFISKSVLMQMYKQWLEFFLFWNVDDDIISSSVGTPFNTHIPMLITWRKEPENSWYVSVPNRNWDVLMKTYFV